MRNVLRTVHSAKRLKERPKVLVLAGTVCALNTSGRVEYLSDWPSLGARTRTTRRTAVIRVVVAILVGLLVGFASSATTTSLTPTDTSGTSQNDASVISAA